MRYSMRVLFFTVALVVLPNIAIRAQDKQPIDLALATQFFQEAKAASDADKGYLWGVSLYGPMLFVDPETRFVVTNQADQKGLRRQQGDLFVGKLSDDALIANTATSWSGVTWTMLMWPLPNESQDRLSLMTHELFHRVQGSLNLPGGNPINRHLDSQDGRTWLRMEYRALERALLERGSVERRDAVIDVLHFRRYRQSVFPKSAAEEAALEINEGLAEYTGIKLSSRFDAESLARAGYKLRNAQRDLNFSRSFAYATGPAYGNLLDAVNKGWRKNVKAGDDLSVLLQSSMGIRLPGVSANDVNSRAKRYGGDEVIAAEAMRHERRLQTMAKYRSRLVEGPVLIIPTTESIRYTFNPNTITPFGDIGMIYPTSNVTDEWGVLEVSDGMLMFRDSTTIQKLHVVAPTDPLERPLRGAGWKLTFNEGWAVELGDRKGDFILRKKK